MSSRASCTDALIVGRSLVSGDCPVPSPFGTLRRFGRRRHRPLVEYECRPRRRHGPRRAASRLPDGFHVQSNKPRDPLLIPTELTVDAPAGVTVEEVVFPACRPT